MGPLLTLPVRGLRVILDLPFRYHLIIGFCIRLFLIVYGNYHDSVHHLKYTDVDYRVFTDAARHVMKGESPYDRHTYRYSPIIAWLLLPNIFLHESFGKVLFVVADILITICIRSFVIQQAYNKVIATKIATYCSLFWLYNPFSIAISTRGNADSVSCLFILLSIYFLQADKLLKKGHLQYTLSGFFLGLSIHLRLYPIVFSFPMYLSLADFKINRNTPTSTGLISVAIPNRNQLTLAIATIASFIICTYGMYLIYGYKFIFETYIYHLFRKDTRHNLSLFFYHFYLRMDDATFDLISFTTKIFVVLIMILLSLAFGSDSRTLPFALFCQAWVLVTYNTVLTSQYYLWFLSLFPLVVHDLKVPAVDGVIHSAGWLFLKGAWLFGAYKLEFLNVNGFTGIWISSLLLFLFSSNMLGFLIMTYTPGHGFGNVRPYVSRDD